MAVASGLSVRELAIAVADSHTSLRGLRLTLDIPARLLEVLHSQIEKLKQEVPETSEHQSVEVDESGGPGVAVDMESLDFGLFTPFPKPRELVQQCTPVIWLTLIGIWPTLLSKFLQMVWCSPIAQEGRIVQRLLPHPNIECGSEVHVPLICVACLGLIFWCAGLPACLFTLIWRLKDWVVKELERG